MEEEDKEFFILVLGVLAAIIMVISWWFTTGGTVVSASRVTTNADSATHDAAEDSDDAHDANNLDDSATDAELNDSDSDNAAPDDAVANDTSSDGTTDAPATDPDVPLAPTVFDAVAGDENLTVITGLLRDAGLDQVLARGGPYTVFAPSNDAINDAAGSDTTIAVLESARDSVLTYHVVPGDYTIADLTDIVRGSRSAELATVQGESISLALEGGNIVINGTATVSGAGQASGNGMVHTLDNVLVPPVAALNALVSDEPILFAAGSATIEAASVSTLDQFIEVLSASDASVEIEGHTDSSGDAILNQNLSQSRARAVLNYLVANGIEESRLSAQGFGSSRPVGDNNTEEGRALNRRIEFTHN